MNNINLPEMLTMILVLAAVILGVVLLVKILASPVKKIFKFILNTLLGMGILFVINLIGNSFGVRIDINVTHCAVAAVFGVPGVLLMVLIKLLL